MNITIDKAVLEQALSALEKAWYSVKIAEDTAAELRRLEAANSELKAENTELLEALYNIVYDNCEIHDQIARKILREA